MHRTEAPGTPRPRTCVRPGELSEKKTRHARRADDRSSRSGAGAAAASAAAAGSAAVTRCSAASSGLTACWQYFSSSFRAEVMNWLRYLRTAAPAVAGGAHRRRAVN